jgi:tetratricopeptide (TPR) repeat protein
MSVISFDDWKKQKEKKAAFTSRGSLREDIAAREEYGYDLCVFISEEYSAPDRDNEHLEQLWAELRALIASLPHEHAYHYFKAFEAFCQGDQGEFIACFDRFLQSEQQLYSEIADCDWWIDCFMWVFTPPFPGMYGQVAELFFKYWPNCAMGYVCEALERAEINEDDVDGQLGLLMLALEADKECYLAYYLTAAAFFDLHQWRSALPYYEKAAGSAMYSQDPAFYFDYAWAAEKAGKPQLALQLYNSCLLLEESYPCAINNYGCVLLQLKRYDEAIAQFNRAINLSLDGALPYRNVVAALERQNKYAECIKYIEANAEMLGSRYLIERDRLKLIQAALEEGSLPLPQGEASIFWGGSSEETDDVFTKRLLEDQLEGAIERGEKVFGRKLRMFENSDGYGRHFYLPAAGWVDLLCVDEHNTLCVIAVYSRCADIEILARMGMQMSAVQKRVARRFQKVEGFVCCADCDEELLKLIADVMPDSVHLYRLALTMEPLR